MREYLKEEISAYFFRYRETNYPHCKKGYSALHLYYLIFVNKNNTFDHKILLITKNKPL